MPIKGRINSEKGAARQARIKCLNYPNILPISLSYMSSYPLPLHSELGNPSSNSLFPEPPHFPWAEQVSACRLHRGYPISTTLSFGPSFLGPCLISMTSQRSCRSYFRRTPLISSISVFCLQNIVIPSYRLPWMETHHCCPWLQNLVVLDEQLRMRTHVQNPAQRALVQAAALHTLRRLTYPFARSSHIPDSAATLCDQGPKYTE